MLQAYMTSSQTLDASFSRSEINWFRKLYCLTMLAEYILLSEKWGKKKKKINDTEILR